MAQKPYLTEDHFSGGRPDLLGMRFGPIQCAPPMTLLGVTRLAIPSLLFVIVLILTIVQLRFAERRVSYARRVDRDLVHP